MRVIENNKCQMLSDVAAIQLQQLVRQRSVEVCFQNYYSSTIWKVDWKGVRPVAGMNPNTCQHTHTHSPTYRKDVT